VAKISDSELGQRAYDGMRALWHSSISRGTVVQLAQPLAYIPPLRVLIQSPIRQEQTLAERLEAALAAGAVMEVKADLEQTAAGLAALHRSDVRHGPRITLADEVTRIRTALDDLAAAVPRLADAAEPLLARIEELDAAYPADPAVPTHHSFSSSTGAALARADRVHRLRRPLPSRASTGRRAVPGHHPVHPCSAAATEEGGL